MSCGATKTTCVACDVFERVPERRGPGPRKENGAVGLCAAQSTGLRARGAGTLLLCCRCPTPTTNVGVAFL